MAAIEEIRKSQSVPFYGRWIEAPRAALQRAAEHGDTTQGS